MSENSTAEQTVFTSERTEAEKSITVEKIPQNVGKAIHGVFKVLWDARLAEQDLESKLGNAASGVRGRMASCVMKVIREAITLSLNADGLPRIDVAVDWAKALFDLGERDLKARDKKVQIAAGEMDEDTPPRTIATIAPTYSQYKSRALQSLKKGFLPDAKNEPMEGETEGLPTYNSPSEYFDAGKASRSAQTPVGDGAPSSTATVLELVKVHGFTKDVAETIQGIMADIRRCAPEDQNEKILPKLQTFRAQLHTLVESVVTTGKTGATAEAESEETPATAKPSRKGSRAKSV